MQIDDVMTFTVDLCPMWLELRENYASSSTNLVHRP